MQKTILPILALAATLQATAQQRYTVDVYLEGQEGHKLSLSYIKNGARHVDTAQKLPDGGVRFTGELSEPSIAVIFNSHPASKFEMSKGGMFIPGPALEFVLEEGRTLLRGKTEKSYMALPKGGKLNREYAKYHAQELPLIDERWTLSKESATAYKSGDTARASALRQKGQSLDERMAGMRRDYVARHPGSLLSVYFLAIMKDSYSPEAYAAAYDKLAPTWKSTFYGKSVAAKIESEKATKLGMTAIDFTKKDIRGNDLSLSSLKGKYVLVDFWGSWCGPCRASHPHMVKLYDHYKGKGLEILGVSDEKSAGLASAEKSWKGAVEKDGINWLHVLNNYGKENVDLVQKYGVSGFPTKFLLDPSGKIIFKMVGGGKESEDMLDAKLKEVFGE